MNKVETKLILLLGCTGKSGYHIANALLSQPQFSVRVVVRSKKKLQQLFKQRQLAFQNIIQGEITNYQTISRAFEKSQIYGEVDIVVSALGSAATFFNENKVKLIQYIVHSWLIQQCKIHGVKRYVLESSALIERPWNLIILILNCLVCNVFHWKLKTQNLLRESGLSYTIIRPPQLVGDYKDQQVTGCSIEQGDKLMGKITRATLAQLVLRTLQTQIPSKVTFQCKQSQQAITNVDFTKLKSDTNLIYACHRRAKRTYLFLITLGMGIMLYTLYNKIFYKPQ